MEQSEMIKITIAKHWKKEVHQNRFRDDELYKKYGMK